ncbi:unnamed protein product [Clonostachys byssicola]|uniref:Uncharacterized protein n=1 Tax=Clonostachys byssicola TaxID=160290 RepID=A0A9N9UK23_9HYPO|nr:unnamed protein product [Clonostachys byssicola]
MIGEADRPSRPFRPVSTSMSALQETADQAAGFLRQWASIRGFWRSIDYLYCGGSKAPLKPESCVDLSLEYDRYGQDWAFDANLEPSKTEEKKTSELHIAKISHRLVDDEDLPDVIKGLTIPKEELDIQLYYTFKLQGNEKQAIFSLSIKVRDFNITVAQIRSVAAAAKASQALANPNVVADGDGSGPVRLLCFTLYQLGGTQNIPVIGVVPQPFDQLGIAWTNRDTSAAELTLLNKEVFNSDPTTRSDPPLITK